MGKQKIVWKEGYKEPSPIAIVSIDFFIDPFKVVCSNVEIGQVSMEVTSTSLNFFFLK